MDLYRSLLFVPAQQERWIAKAPSTGSDAIILDLEDALPVHLKEPVRRGVREAVRAVAGAGTPCLVRVNGLDSGMLFEDLDAVADPALAGVVLAKTETPDEIRAIDAYLGALERRRGIGAGRIELIVVAETAMGIHRAFDICRASPRVGSIAGVTARGGDVSRALGYVWTRAGLETLYLRSKILVEARAAGIAYPLSGTWTDIEDLEGLRAQARLNRQLGYRGELVIHPSHVPVVNEAYSPTAEEIEYCQGLVEAMVDAERAGLAAVRYRGALVDYAHLRTARETLAQARRFGLG